MEELIKRELESITGISGARRDRRVAAIVEFVVGHVERTAEEGAIPPEDIPAAVDAALMEHVRMEIAEHRAADEDGW